MSTDGLQALAEQARFELECLGYPAREWVTSRMHDGAPVYDVVIVGGGQSGVAIAFALMRERVTNVAILDRSPRGLEGPWITFARMHTLRTPKTVTGPELGIPSLSVRAWWEARFGKASWASLGRIPRDLWQDYLQWLRTIVGITVTNNAAVTDIEPLADGLFAVHARIGGKTERRLARNIVLATGIEGSGRWLVPEMFKALPRVRYAHTSEAIDFAALSGRRVSVIGGGASAFDNAAVALEHGAARVDLFVRRKALPTINPNRWIEFAGFLRHFADLDDARKWRFMTTIFGMNQPPPQDTFARCARFANFHIHLGSPIDALIWRDNQVWLSTPYGREPCDFVIVGTGLMTDLTARPELARFADRIALWSDRYTPPAGEDSATLGGFPYLSGNFQFMEKSPGAAPFLKHVFSYTFGAMPSLANSAGISQLKFGVERLVQGITRELFLDEADQHLEALKAYSEPELDMSVFEQAPSGVSHKVA